jgi:hypothetical protein
MKIEFFLCPALLTDTCSSLQLTNKRTFNEIFYCLVIYTPYHHLSISNYWVLNFFVLVEIHKRPLNQLKTDSKTDAAFPSGLPLSILCVIKYTILFLSPVHYTSHLVSLSVSCAMCEFKVKTR